MQCAAQCAEWSLHGSAGWVKLRAARPFSFRAMFASFIICRHHVQRCPYHIPRCYYGCAVAALKIFFCDPSPTTAHWHNKTKSFKNLVQAVAWRMQLHATVHLPAALVRIRVYPHLLDHRSGGDQGWTTFDKAAVNLSTQWMWCSALVARSIQQIKLLKSSEP